MLFINLAHAAETTTAEPSIWPTIAIFGVLFIGLYFFMIRPQQKRNKEVRELLASITIGDEVLINGGIIGTISQLKAEDDLVQLTISDGVDIVTKKGFIIQVLPKGTIDSIKKIK